MRSKRLGERELEPARAQALSSVDAMFKDLFNRTRLSQRDPVLPWCAPHQPDPNGSGHKKVRLVLALVGASALGLLMGVAIETWHYGGSAQIISSALAKPTLQQAKHAFRDGEDNTAVAEFTKLADENNPTAQYWLAHMTELGLGVSRDPTKAIALYKRAAAHQEVPAEVRLGEIYMNGNLVPPDFSLAKSYLGKAAHHGDPRAAMLLGQMYDRGLGTTVDKREAYAWSEVSVLEGSVAAKRERDAVLEALGPEDQKAAITLTETILADITHAANSLAAPS